MHLPVMAVQWSPGPTLDGPVHTYVAYPAGPVQGIVVFFHGAGMHAVMPRYDRMVGGWTHAGLGVVAWDCPHMGTSSTLADRAHPMRAMRLHDEVQLLRLGVHMVDAAKGLFPSVPLVLVGESLGGAIALRLAPLTRPVGIATLCGVVQTRILTYPTPIGALVGNIALLREAFHTPGHVRRALLHDPLVYKKAYPVSMLRFMKNFVRSTNYSAVCAPLLFVVGAQDAIVRAKEASRALSACTSVSPIDRTIYEVPRMRHSFTEGAADAVVAFAARLVQEGRGQYSCV